VKIVLLRVGIDSGSGGAHGPLFRNGSFEFVPIPDAFEIDERTYGNTAGRSGKQLVHYLPPTQQPRMANRPMHVDPDFVTFTYGDPTRLKSGLRRLEQGDLLIFYGGLQGWDVPCRPALYLLGYFEVAVAGRAIDFTDTTRQEFFSENMHVRHTSIFERQSPQLTLIKGGPGSRLLTRAVRISEVGRDRRGYPLHILSAEMREIFGSFGSKESIQRSTPRWVRPQYVEQTAAFARALN
jgi:hypothetical protein